MHATFPLLRHSAFPTLRRRTVDTLQVNLGYACNQSCLHCHVNAGPKRTESMAADTVDLVQRYLSDVGAETIDLTGGAPELNPEFRRLVAAARARGLRIIDRCNLTVLSEPGHEDLAEFLAGQRVEITASLPCYLEDNVDRQRGKGVFARSIRGLQQLNALGYGFGEGNTALTLNLVYNPQGASLPPPQAMLEADYRRHLLANYGVRFNRLFTMTNMPIARFGSTLISHGRFNDYLRLLQSAHAPENLEQVMCRSLVSIDWQGYVYDCDFNQMLGIPLVMEDRRRPHLSDVVRTNLAGNPIAVAEHCWGCTAGQGSSCGGALART